MDEFAGCLTWLYDLFYGLERLGLLNPNDEKNANSTHFNHLLKCT